jgi:hypothetical protein
MRISMGEQYKLGSKQWVECQFAAIRDASLRGSDNRQREFPTAQPLTGGKFQLGSLLLPEGLRADLTELYGNEQWRFPIGTAIRLHGNGDWGDISEDEKKLNDAAIANEGDPARQFRVRSAYEIHHPFDPNRSPVKIWVVTEADRSRTAIMLAGRV